VGLDLAVIPPLSCERRFVLDWTKTEETNRTPVLPRPRVTFALPELGPLRPYAGFAYVPPVPIAETRATVVSGEFGLAAAFGEEDKWQVGGRFHATSAKVVADIASAFDRFDPPVADLFTTQSFGADVSFGADLGAVTPYAAIGVTDVSTFFYIGDDGVVANNLHPYAGPTVALGADALLVNDRLRLGAELFGAPGGHSRPDPDAETIGGFGRYGHLYTVRLRVAAEL
jgi:hypothetical protein